MAFNTIREESKPKSHSQDFVPSFIRKTYDILEEARFPQFIDWNQEGTALVIKKPSEFSQKVLPIYFKHNNFTSFVRQLNMYDFHKKRTQGLDHVYVHDLFQKGKRHLLQGIKRKTHENTSEKILKASEVQQVPTTAPEDLTTLFKENQLFKHLYNEAMNRIAALEHRAKELAVQHQTLLSQVCRQNESERAFKPNIVKMESQSELTLDQLPMTMGKMTLNLTAAYKPPAQVTRLFAPNSGESYMKPSISTVRADLQREESSVSGGSTEISRNSPVGQCDADNEEIFESPITQKGETFSQFASYPKMSYNNQVPPMTTLKITNGLSISRQEMSAGQMIDSWNFDLGNDEILCFADQKVEKPIVNIQTTYQERSGLLGKRQFEQSVDMSFYVNEPPMKRSYELCISNKRGLMSSGIEDQEGVENNLYASNLVPSMGRYGIDLMEF